MASGVGAFGKIPAMGDFLRVNLAAGFVQAWDAWLQTGLLAGHEALGQSWTACYMSAPIWRFTLPAGQAGAAGMMGVMMASVDRVGRQYPLTLAMPVAVGDAAQVHFAAKPVFAELEDIALSALDDDTDRDGLVARLSTVEAQGLQAGAWANGRYAGMMAPEDALGAQSLSQTYPGCGIWTAAIGGAHRLMMCRALPNAAEVTGLFDPEAGFWNTPQMAVQT